MKKGPKAARCKGCDALIFWAKTPAGKNMPFNVSPAARAEWIAYWNAKAGVVSCFRDVRGSAGYNQAMVNRAYNRYQPHWETCPRPPSKR